MALTPFDEWLSRVRQKHGSKFEYDRSSYLGIKKKISIKCPEHGWFEQLARDHLSKGCAKCRGLSSFSRRVVTADSFAKELSEIRSDFVIKELGYVNASTKVNLRCSVHGPFQLRPDAARRGDKCPRCRVEEQYDSTDSFIQKAVSVHGEYYDYSQVKYTHSKGDVTVVCPKHGPFVVQAWIHLAQARGCPLCTSENRSLESSKTKKEYVRLWKAKYGDRFTYENVPSTLPLPGSIHVTCRSHGTFEVNRVSFTHGAAGCPKCRSTGSAVEDIVKGWFPDVFLVRDRKTLNGRELDLLSVDKKLAVEVNGVYWHSHVSKSKDYHIRKTLDCRKEGIQLLQFWDYEVIARPEVVRSMISSRLGQSTRLHARKMEVVELSSSEASAFLEKNHLQGSVNSKVRLGLKSPTGRIAMVMTFGKPRYNSQVGWELLRMASHVGISVAGGASKLLTFFERKYHPSSLLSYADLRYSQGQTYRKLGFVFQRRTPPSYQWIYGTRRLSRYQTQKHRLDKLLGEKFDPERSEFANMCDAGYLQVFDCGTLVYEKNYSEEAK